MPNENVDRKLITSITIDGLEYELIHIPKEVKEAYKKSKQAILDYEILTVRGINNNDNIIECKYRGLFNPDYYEIHSVKRLSDNEVFTIDDKVSCTLTELYSRVLNNDFIVEKIEISGEPYLMAVGHLLPLRNAKKVINQELFEVKLTKSELYKLMQLINGQETI